MEQRRHRRRFAGRRAAATLVVLALAQFGVVSVLAAGPAQAIECGPGQWAGDYFDGVELGGEPVGEPAGSRCDAAVDFDWSAAGPGVGGLGAEFYSVRWVQDVTFAEGTYTFSATADDGVRVLLDGVPVIDEWQDQGPTTFTAEVPVATGAHQLTVEYYQRGGGAVVRFSYAAAAPEPPVCPATQWTAAYYPNTALADQPWVECEDAVSHDWGEASPGVGPLGADNFSVRWTRSDTFEGGPVTFTATADDGVRMYLDTTLVIDEWQDQGPTTFTAVVDVPAGTHDVTVEYYERGAGAVVSASYSGAALPPVTCPTTQWSASYFANPALAGQASAQQCEDLIDYDWGGSGPGVAGVGVDNFSVRWIRTQTFGAGPVEFTATADDGVRVYFDDTLVIDEWQDQGPTTFTATVDVTAGVHTVKVEYYEHGGGAVARVTYTGAPPPACTSIEWEASYFDSTTLSGQPVLVRCESPLSYDFGENGPDVPGIGPYNFSVRWERTDDFAGGDSVFTATADDGVRMYLDGAIVIDEWRDQGPTTFTATVPVSAGEHTVTVEYYQGGGGGLVRASYTGGGAPGEVPPPPPGGCVSDCEGDWEVLPYQSPLRSIHATVLRTGNVLLVAGSGNNEPNFNAGNFASMVWNPLTGAFVDVPDNEDLFCVGHTQLADGRILLQGGTLGYPTPTSNYKGLASSYVFDPISGTYTRINDTPGGGHWYPTLTNLGNGDVFATGGLNEEGSGNVATEMYDASENRWLDLNEVQQTYFYWGLYPAMVLMADGRLFYSGVHTFGNALPGTSGSEIYDVNTGTITDVPGLRDIDFRDQGATVLLPPAQAQVVANFGGGNSYSPRDPNNLLDLIDLTDPDPSWTAGADLPAAKMYVSAVILPDGKVLETGGALHNYAEYAVYEASVYDPVTDTFTPVAPDPLARMYHSQAFLLADGRVATIGNNPATGAFDLGISIYSPWYMDESRPTVVSSPTQFDYGSTQNLTVSGDIGRVTLIRPASVTHQSDPNQRSVDLPVTGTGTGISVGVPNNPNVLPPGYYMMFVQDNSGVPSVATWVHVG